jgi:hypothetical protein
LFPSIITPPNEGSSQSLMKIQKYQQKALEQSTTRIDDFDLENKIILEKSWPRFLCDV